MREYLGTNDIANAIMMLRTAFKGTVVVVEGITDRRLYGKFFAENDVEVVIAHSKDNVRNAVRTVYVERKMKSVIGIIDADLDHLLEKKRNPPLFITDTRDSESMMLKSGALEDVLSEYGDNDAVERFTDSFGSVRDAVLDSAYPVGVLMYISEKENLGLSFKDLDFYLFTDKRSLRCDIRRMIDTVVGNTKGRTVGAKRIHLMLDKELQTERDPWLVCRGHDIISVMVIALRSTFGSHNSRYIREGELSGSFRLGFDTDDLVKTKLYADTSKWCDEHGLKLWSV